MGVPSSFTQEIADKICEELVSGRSLRSICEDEGMPNPATVYRWLQVNEKFREQYARAREDQADTLVDEILDIADDSSHDVLEKQNRDGSTYEVFNTEFARRSQIRIEARQWLAGKLRPKKYGDKITTELTGADGGPVAVEASGASLAFALRKAAKAKKAQ